MSRPVVVSSVLAVALFVVAATSHAFPSLPNAAVDHEAAACVVRSAVSSFVAPQIDVAELAAGTSPWQMSVVSSTSSEDDGDAPAGGEVLTAVAVPEPPTYAIAMVAGVLGAGAMARRKSKPAAA